MKEMQVTIPSMYKLKGTLALPEQVNEKLPAILLMAGSGKLDRNGKASEKLDLKVYGQLAHTLTDLGFITLRYDKRGVGESDGDFNCTGMWDLVEDAIASIHFLKQRPEVDPNKVIILGHSEGAMLGTTVAVREQVSGLILLSGAVERLEEAMARQRSIAADDIMSKKGFLGWLLRAFKTHKKIEPQAQKFLAKVMATEEDIIKVQFQKVNAKWIREHFEYDVIKDLEKVNVPVLAITGARDIQANPNVLRNLAKYVKGDSEYHIIDNMGHSLKYQSETSTMFSIKKDLVKEASLPIHPELEPIIKSWLDKHVSQTNKEQLNSI
ncbi:alpha/beta hydrolase [Bacillus pinisoli]|uniref:alpha/beta hydrolase n=1 Tax=Bacillus pinisoli TaxID=2901866 RepID=UPI001FF383EE|nr:alpha/beta fold hydrolase [Bacillus pinisoli]